MLRKEELLAKHPERVAIGAEYKAKREELGFSRTQLAEALGIKTTTLSNLESGQGAYVELRKELDAFFEPVPTTGPEFRKLRDDKKLSRKKLVVDLEGVSEKRLADFENAKVVEDAELVEQLSAFFGIRKPVAPPAKKKSKTSTTKPKTKSAATGWDNLVYKAKATAEAKANAEAKTIALAKLDIELEKAGVRELIEQGVLNKKDILELLK